MAKSTCNFKNLSPVKMIVVLLLVLAALSVVNSWIFTATTKESLANPDPKSSKLTDFIHADPKIHATSVKDLSNPTSQLGGAWNLFNVGDVKKQGEVTLKQTGTDVKTVAEIPFFGTGSGTVSGNSVQFTWSNFPKIKGMGTMVGSGNNVSRITWQDGSFWTKQKKTTTIPVPAPSQCAANYGSTIASDGTGGTVESQYICTKEKPKCVGYHHNKSWGTCQV